jgi:Dolichyl-phosphate-mannose-protein mannosyltransferase
VFAVSERIAFGRRSYRSFLRPAAVLVALYSVAVLCLWTSGAFRGEFADYPDEAGHYVTGLLFHDCLVGFHYLSPMRFAEDFYLHYPKVALGHWPPVFYLLQAAWTLIFSVSHTSLMLFMAALTMCLAFVMYRMLLPELGHWVSLTVAVIFTALPVVQLQTGTLMADVPVTLFMLLATVSFGCFLDTERATDAVVFGVWSAIAIMTKGNAFALVFVPPVAIAVMRKWKLFLRPAVWASAAIVMILCGPWYWLTLRMAENGLTQPSATIGHLRSAFDYFWMHLGHTAGWSFALLAFFGFAIQSIELFRGRNVRGIWPALCGLLLGCMVIFCAIPTGLEERYLLPALTALIGFLALGTVRLASKLRLKKLQPAAVIFVLLLCFAAAGFSFPRTHSRGYAAVANALLHNPQMRHSVILISSDADGEGSFISEVAMHEKRPGHIILRATKVIASSDWLGQHAKLLFNSPAQVLDYLDSIPANVVILDYSASCRVYEDLLEEAMSAPPHHWKLSASYPLWKRGVEDPAAVRVYICTVPASNPQGLIHVDLQRMLGKTLTLKLPAHYGAPK